MAEVSKQSSLDETFFFFRLCSEKEEQITAERKKSCQGENIRNTPANLNQKLIADN